MRLAVVDYLPLHNREWLLIRIGRMDEVVGAWFRGQLEVALCLAALYAAGLAVTFGLAGVGVSTGVAIGLVSGFLNIVPYFGFVIGFGLSVLVCLVDWQPWALLGVLLTFSVVQALEGYVITPRIVGEKVGLSPVVVIIALLVGGELLGLLGVLLARERDDAQLLLVVGAEARRVKRQVSWRRLAADIARPGRSNNVAPGR